MDTQLIGSVEEYLLGDRIEILGRKKIFLHNDPSGLKSASIFPLDLCWYLNFHLDAERTDVSRYFRRNVHDDVLELFLDDDVVASALAKFKCFWKTKYSRWTVLELLRRQAHERLLKRLQGKNKATILGVFILYLEGHPLSSSLLSEIHMLLKKREIENWLHTEYPDLWNEHHEMLSNPTPMFAAKPSALSVVKSLSEQKGSLDVWADYQVEKARELRSIRTMISIHDLTEWLKCDKGYLVKEDFEKCKVAVSEALGIELMDRGFATEFLKVLSEQRGPAVIGAMKMYCQGLSTPEIEAEIRVIADSGRFWELVSPYDHKPTIRDFLELAFAQGQHMVRLALEYHYPVVAHIPSDLKEQHPEFQNYLDEVYKGPWTEDFLRTTSNPTELMYGFDRMKDQDLILSSDSLEKVLAAVESLQRLLESLLPYVMKHQGLYDSLLLRIIYDNNQGRNVRINAGILAIELGLKIDFNVLPPLFRKLDVPQSLRKLIVPCNQDEILESVEDRELIHADWYLELLWCARSGFGQVGNRADFSGFLKEWQGSQLAGHQDAVFPDRGCCFTLGIKEEDLSKETLEAIDTLAAKHGCFRIPHAYLKTVLWGFPNIASSHDEAPTLEDSLLKFF